MPNRTYPEHFVKIQYSTIDTSWKKKTGFLSKILTRQKLNFLQILFQITCGIRSTLVYSEPRTVTVITAG